MSQLEQSIGRFLTSASVCPRSGFTRAAWIAALLAISTLVRWSMDPFLGHELPFFLYLPAVLLAVALCGFGAGLATLLGSLVLTALLWVPVSGSWLQLEAGSLASIAVWLVVSVALIYAVALLQKSAVAQHGQVAELRRTSAMLEEKSARLAASEKAIGAHADSLERVVAERTARLEETIAELDSFSYTVSHDLRSPLRAMQAFAHLLLEEYSDKLDATGRAYLQKIDAAARRLDALIRDVLTFSSIGRGKVAPVPIDLERLIQQVIAQHPRLERAREQIEVERPLLPVMGSGDYLGHVLSNLLLNAVTFVPPGSNPAVRVWTAASDHRVRLHVTDRGVGIARSALPHIFKPFHRGRGADRYEGTGIGLAIVRRAVERLGGSVGVASEPGHGSDFWIELPLATTSSHERPADSAGS